MVSAADPRAAAAGAEMLRRGGSAVDAAIATLLALNVVEPQSSGIGGGGFLVYSDRGGDPVTYDGRETAPAAAGPSWFLKDGRPMPFDEAVPGGKSVGVPGNVRLMALAHGKHGKLPWAMVFEPAIRLARDGFAMSPRLNFALARGDDEGSSVAASTPAGRALYFDRDGRPLAVGTTIRNPAFAALLEQLAALGPDSFYVGPNAQAIVAAVNGSARNPSPMTAGDVAAYEAKPRTPVCGHYRAHRVCGMGPVSSGGTTVFAILKQLERFDLAALGPNHPTSWHLIAESMRLAFADRDKYLADPDFVRVPVAGLIDPGYLAGRSALIAADGTMAGVAAGVPPGAPVAAVGEEAAEHGTSHFVAVDRWGNVASQTSTIESAFGSGLVVNGYYLNNELTDFSFVPAVAGVPVANRVEGGKRPRSSMSPTIVWGPDGRVRLALGAAGGPTIIAQVAKAIIGVIDWKLSAQQAIALPTVFAPGDTVYLERGTFLEPMAPQLRALGHARIGYRPPMTFKANAIEWAGGRWVGAADPRSEGAAVSE
ncbi:MAG TPA: gamma-glutamyltransferase [Sphingomicrobium sp.]|nr:gamma-glutamyltransferase [Sphingomicrobium sp.]